MHYNINIPTIFPHTEHTCQFYLFLLSLINREELIKKARSNLLELTSHFEPLHDTKPGKNFGKCYDNLNHTKSLSRQIIRVPIHTEMTKKDQNLVLKILENTLKECLKK